MQLKDRNTSRRDVGIFSVVCLLCQLGLAPAISLGAGHPNLALVFSALVSLTYGGDLGVACGFAAGLVFDLSTTGPMGLMTLLLTVMAFILGMETHDRLGEDVTMTLIPVAVSALAVSLAYHLSMLLAGEATSLFDVVVVRALPTALLTFVAYVIIGLLVARFRQGGAPRLGGPSLGRRRGPRYTISSK